MFGIIVVKYQRKIEKATRAARSIGSLVSRHGSGAAAGRTCISPTWVDSAEQTWFILTPKKHMCVVCSRSKKAVADSTLQGWIIFNTCPRGGDDDGLIPRDPQLPIYTAAAQCSMELCYVTQGLSDDSWGCGVDPYADEFLLEDDCQITAAGFHSAADSASRNISSRADAKTHGLVKRGGPRDFEINWYIAGVVVSMVVSSLRYAGGTHLHDPSPNPPAPDLAFR